jgi:cellulose synthase/poly-beta-1,6-N-acetylglucosamine synthase-like glycosyltransferase
MILVFVYIVFCIGLFTLYLLGKNKAIEKTNHQSGKKYQSECISVIIPFRNEEAHLPELIKSIQQLSKQPLEFIWVNDHSTDKSVSILDTTLPNQNHTLLHLTDELTGKKNALSFGISKAKGEYILTWDADIIVPSNYFQQLESYTINALSILPVEMNPSNYKTTFFAKEFHFLNQLNYALFGLKRPILANGANLLFDKSVFNQLQPYQNNLTIASGDDQFLLKQFREKNQSISYLKDKGLTVTTKTPSTLKQCFNQRNRWASKTQKVNDQLANGIGILGMAYHFSPILFLTISLNSFLITFLLKSIFDFTILDQKFNPRNILNAFIFSLIYPFYVVTLGIASLFIKVSWKDRVII